MRKPLIAVSVSIVSVAFILATVLSSEILSLACAPMESALLSPQKKTAEPKPAEQVYKNVKIFRGLPDQISCARFKS